MNKLYKSILYSLFFLVLTGTVGCKKYGYEHADGYENGEPSANNPWGSSDTLGKDFSKIEQARFFPGLVGDEEPRLQNQTVTIDFSPKFVKTIDIKINVTPQPWFSTGFYAAPGEPVKIEIPAGQDGLIAMVGGWTDNLTNITPLKRDPIITNQVQLKGGVNYIRNLYGGSLYIRTNGVVENIGAVPVTISGAVKSPDFVLGQSGDAEWNQRVQQSEVPWFQLRGKRIIFELPKFLLDKHPIPNPTALMEEWDRIIDLDVYKWKALKDVTADSMDKAPELPMRLIMDVQPRTSSGLVYAHGSYPIVLQLDENMFVNEITNLTSLTTSGAIRTMYEIGRNNLNYMWPFSAISQTAPNFFSLKMANRLGIPLDRLHANMSAAVDSAIRYSSRPKTWASSFAKDIINYPNYDLVKLMPFVQLMELYGYGIMGTIDSITRHSPRSFTDQEKVNLWYTVASEYAQTNLYVFFKQWGVVVSPQIADQLFDTYPILQDATYKYNPITKNIIGPNVLPLPTRMIDRTAWRVIDFCCQESDVGAQSYAQSTLDGDSTTYWHSRWKLVTAPHYPHYITYDMASTMEINGFWYMNFHATWRVKNFKIFVSPDNMEWTEVYSTWPNGNTAFNNVGVVNQGNFDSTYTVKFVKFEMNDAFSSSSNNALSVAEFGALRPTARY